MKAIFGALGVLLIAPGALAAPPAPPDRSSPEKTVRSFLGALSRGDVRAGAACVRGATLGPHSAEMEREFRKHPATLTATKVQVKSDGDAATVTMTITAVAPRGPRGGLATQDSVRLRREGALWKIVADDPRKPRPAGSGFASVLATLLAYKGATR